MGEFGFEEVSEKLRQSTVQIQTMRSGGGSGVIWTREGLIITNAHVVRSGEPAEVRLWNGKCYLAALTKVDRGRDLAALQIEVDVDAPGLAAAIHGDSGALRPGELVIAVGSPNGFAGAVSTGVVHSVGPLPQLDANNWILTDARLAPGNSGGPLANARGEVVGVNTMIAGGMGFAVPSQDIAKFLTGPAQGNVGLGVIVRPVSVGTARKKQLGLLVLEIVPNSGAERASLKPGDILTGSAGNPFQSPDDLEHAIRSASGQTLELQFRRGPEAITRTVVATVDVGILKAA